MTSIELHNLYYEHRKNVCRLMATGKMTQYDRDRLYRYSMDLQRMIDKLAVSISYEIVITEPAPVEKDRDVTIKDYIDAGYRDVQG